MSRVCVIGAGFGGLALAIRLQAAGHAVTLIEAQSEPGGTAARRTVGGIEFDLCPAAIDDPGALHELWETAGRDLSAELALLPVSPPWRLDWPDGTRIDWSLDAGTQARMVARLAPGDLAGYEQFMAYAAETRTLGMVRLGDSAHTGIGTILAALPMMVRQQAWRSLETQAALMVRSDKLRQALSFRAILRGGSPLATPAPVAATLRLEAERGVWWPQGGMAALARAMAGLFSGIGGELRLGDPVVRIEALGNRAHAVACASGWRGTCDAVASNADLMHTYRTLLAGTARGATMAKRLERGRWSPGVFAVHFALEGSFPAIAHNTMLFGPRWEGLLDDIFEHGVLPRDMLIRLAHPAASEPGLAAAGRTQFSAFVPVANMARLPIDWEAIGPVLQERVLAEIGRRLIPDLKDRLVTAFHTSPRDAALDRNAWAGSFAGLEPRLLQSLWLRPRHRDEGVPNLYLVGSGTHPGAGFSAVLSGARAVAQLITDDARQ